MIKSWANSRSRRFYEEGKVSKFRSLDTDATDELLAALDAATSLKDLSPLKSVGLHKLSGDRGAGQWKNRGHSIFSMSSKKFKFI